MKETFGTELYRRNKGEIDELEKRHRANKVSDDETSLDTAPSTERDPVGDGSLEDIVHKMNARFDELYRQHGLDPAEQRSIDYLSPKDRAMRDIDQILGTNRYTEGQRKDASEEPEA